jgi:agmatine deiminase
MSIQNLRLPAEWEKQSAVLLTWPHAHSDWAPLLTHVEPVFIELARQITQHEQLVISCYDSAHERYIRRLLQYAGLDSTKLHTYLVPSNDTWVRDHGPITVLKEDVPYLLDFTFNGWGQKFNGDLDNHITRRLHDSGAFGSTTLETFDFVLEGGAIETDGAGTLLTTSRCLLSPKRNPQFDRAQIEAKLTEFLGTDRVLWLEHGYLAGDDTDSHIDMLARFCNPHTLCYVACDDSQDEHHAALLAMKNELKMLRTREGNPYELVPLPWPRAKHAADGRRLPASYANFLIINGAVLVPSYDDAADEEALRCLRGCFPRHEVIAIPCLPLIQQHGSLHCVTMQLHDSIQGPAKSPSVQL